MNENNQHNHIIQPYGHIRLIVSSGNGTPAATGNCQGALTGTPDIILFNRQGFLYCHALNSVIKQLCVNIAGITFKIASLKKTFLLCSCYSHCQCQLQDIIRK